MVVEMTEKDALLPCPFCGGEPIIAGAIDGYCFCPSRIEACAISHRVCAISAWNTRALTRAPAMEALRPDIMRAIYEAHRGKDGYSRFHTNADVRAKAQKHWDTLRERKPEEWANLEGEADAVLAALGQAALSRRESLMADTPEERIVVREWHGRWLIDDRLAEWEVIEAEHNAVVSELRAALAREATPNDMKLGIINNLQWR